MDEFEKEKRAVRDRIIADILKGVSLFDAKHAPPTTSTENKRYTIDWDELKKRQLEEPFEAFPQTMIPNFEEAEKQRLLEEARARQRADMINREYERQLKEKQAALDANYKRMQAEQTAAEMAIAAAQAKLRQERELEEQRRQENPNWGAW